MQTGLSILSSILLALAAQAKIDKPLADTHLSFPIGSTLGNHPILAWISRENLDIHSTKKRILIVAGMEGEQLFVRHLKGLKCFTWE